MPRVSGDVGAVDETMRYDLHFRRPVEQSAARGMDSPPTRHQAGMPPGPPIVHSGCGCLGSIHFAGVLARGP